jgi:hypothetical protein
MTGSFAVRIEIDTPISLRSLLHFDGLLGALLTARGGLLDEIPLERHLGIWQGSAAILETGPFGPVMATNTRIKHVAGDGVPAGLLDHLRPGERRINTMHSMRNLLTPYPCLDGVRAVWFIAKGDAEATRDLLSDVRNLGAMGRTGWGRVVDTAIFDVANNTLTGLVLPSGLPARTMPVSTWKMLDLAQSEAAIISMRRPTPPYWAGKEVLCISPLQVDIMGTATEIRSMVGELHWAVRW